MTENALIPVEQPTPSLNGFRIADEVAQEPTKPKPKSRAQERIKELVKRNRALKEEKEALDKENEELAHELEEALALNMKITERLLQMTGGQG